MKFLSLPVIAAAILGVAGCGQVAAQPGQTDSLLSNGCTAGGDARSLETQALDRLKNRVGVPAEIDPSATLQSMLAATSDSNAFDQNKGATVDGYLVKVTLEKGESCNCHSKSKEDWDYHCYIAATANPGLGERLVAEVTPRERVKTLEEMKALVGQKVKVTGWIMNDFKHKDASEADSPGRDGDWRASCWEIHPITAIEIVHEGQP